MDEYFFKASELSRDLIESLTMELLNFRSNRAKATVIAGRLNPQRSTLENLGQEIASAHIAVSIDSELATLENFLSWVSDPLNIGFKPGLRRRTISTEQLNSVRATLGRRINSYKTGSIPSRRPQPLEAAQLASIHSLIDPVTASASTSVRTSSLFPRTPWELKTSLRNWLMFCLAEQHGLRIGEVLKLTLEDIVSLTPGGPLTVHVRRRPDDPLDTRVNPPSVKTAERVLELASQLRRGFRIYLTQPPPVGRVSGSTPYLFVTEDGHALSYLSAHRALQVLSRVVEIPNLCWHRLRHTWAESLARELFALNGIEEQAIEKLRYLGGWSERSHTPFHYIRNAIQESANDFLRRRNERMYCELKIEHPN